MIWDSVVMMTVIDSIIIFFTVLAFRNFYQYRHILKKLNLFTGVAVVLGGIIMINSLYFADIITMHILPRYIREDRAMTVMRDLHLNYNWIISTIGIGMIVMSLIYLNKTIFPEIIRLKENLKQLVVTDSLTNTYNRNKFDEVIKRETESAHRYDKSLSVMVFDLDNFKRINDTYGHFAGDDVLKAVASITKKNIRATDYLIRWGGEEFMVIMPETAIERAELLAERITRAVESFQFEGGGNMTISTGIAQLRKKESVESFIKRADSALYRAKNKGKNRVEVEAQDVIA